ncbi:MAG: bacterioferritin-associated ferredoxin [Xanthomonadales bacterium]
MYICICQAVTDTAIRRAVDEGVTTLPELSLRTGAGTQCGSCIPMAREILDEALAERNAPPSAVNLRVVCSN